ncbi:MAG: histidine ammonia-lyase [Bacteroidota bacterium]
MNTPTNTTISSSTYFQFGEDWLTVSKVLGILRGDIKAELSLVTQQHIQASHEEVLAIASGDDAVYGINTGFGPLCNTIIEKQNTVDLQRNLLLSHAVGVGNPIGKELSKLMLILKVHSLAKAFSGISLEVINRILWHIEQDVIPVVPEQGSVGASGDLAPLSHLFLPLLGEGEVYWNQKIVPTSIVLEAYEMAPLQLHPKAGLALINGTQFILAHAVRVVEKLHSCLAHADLIGAMMIEGLLGSASPFHPKLHQTRPHKGNVHVAGRIARFLKDSEIVESHKNCGRVQDPYSLRCIPQVHGSSRVAWLHLKEAVETEMNSVTDNPIIFSRDFTISGGSFHGQPLALPLDYACLAAAELGSISDRRTYFSLEGIVDNLPKLLMRNTGLHSGFMIVQYTSAALVSENKGLCFPSSADSIPTSLGQEDHVSMGSIGGRKALRVCENVIKILATELICAAQAFDYRKPLLSSNVLDAVHDHIRGFITHAEEDRIFALDLKKAIQIIESGELLSISRDLKEQPYSEHDELFEHY